MKKLLLVLLFLPCLAWGQAFPLFDPATGILKGNNNTYVTTAATSSDVISLWTGSCSSTTFLRGDGSCQAPGGAGIGTVTSVAMSWASSGISIGGSPITSAGTLALTGTLNVGTGGTGATTLTGLLKGNGSSAFTAAVSADAISLWTGTCNSTTFLRGDGSCQSAAGTSANPSASVGPTAVNGVATTFMRSDGAPPINLTSTYAWTGSHSYGLAGTLAAPSMLVSSSQPVNEMRETDAAANNQRWYELLVAEQLQFRVGDDAGSTSGTWMAIDRTANTIDTVNITATAVQANGNGVLTTASSLAAANLTGSVADARLSGNVALKNVANQTFSNVGANSLFVENTSTGDAVFILKTNGITRSYLCTSTIAGNCVTGSAANDTVLRGSQKIRVSTDDGASSNAVFTNAQIDLNATAVQANGSRVNTVANSGKVAFARVDGSGSVQSALNVTSLTRTGTGSYSIDLTAAGFTQKPACVIGTSTTFGFISIANFATAPFNGVIGAYRASVSGGALVSTAEDPVEFQVICHGN